MGVSGDIGSTAREMVKNRKTTVKIRRIGCICHKYNEGGSLKIISQQQDMFQLRHGLSGFLVSVLFFCALDQH